MSNIEIELIKEGYNLLDALQEALYVIDEKIGLRSQNELKILMSVAGELKPVEAFVYDTVANTITLS